MKTQGMSIQIPNPCHEPWEGMQPNGQGRFCGSCQKTVIDFSGKSDAEIRDLLLAQAGQKVCGHFKKTQVNRPLKFDLPPVSRYIVPRKVFAMALLFVFGTSLVSCYDFQGKRIEGIELNTNIPGWDLNATKGEILPPDSVLTETAPVKTPTLLVPPDTEPVMRGDVVVVPEIMGKVEFVPDPTDSLLQGEVKTCPPDPTDSLVKIDDAVLHTVGMIRMPDHLNLDTIIPDINESGPLEVPGDTAVSRVGNTDKFPRILNPENGLSVFPNPSDGVFTIEYKVSTPSDVRLDIFDMAGNFMTNLVNVPSQHSGNYRIPVDLSHKAAGAYVAVLIQNGKRSTARLIVSK